MPRSRSSRRQFLHSSVLAPAGYWIASRNAWAQSRSPNEVLQVACIGVGGKGKTDVASVAAAGANVVALCEVDDLRGRESYESFPKATRFHDYRKMFDKLHQGIDAVVVSTPDHTHAPASMMAMKLGKHVYTQKPLTHDVYEARLLRETAREHRLVSQMGNQGTANDLLREAIEVIQSGVLGAILEVHVWTNRPIWPQGTEALLGNSRVRSALYGQPDHPAVPSTLQWDLWLGSAPQRQYDRIYAPFNWRGWLDFGTGALGDMACHIMNIPWHALKLGAPTSVEADVAPDLNDETYPSWSVVRYEFPGRGALPPVKVTWYDGGKNLPAIYRDRLAEVSMTKPTPSNAMVCIGERGRLLSAHETGAKYQLLPREHFMDHQPPISTLPRVPSHYHEWVHACIENKPDVPMSNFSSSGPLTEMVLLGCVAMRARQRIEWDAASLKVTNAVKANQFLRREYRSGWTV